MRVLNLVISATLATVGFAQTIAQDVAAIPSCATDCLYPAIAAIGCGSTDWTCICGQKAALRADAFTCIVSACSTADALTTEQLAGEICVLSAASSSSSSEASTLTQSSTTTSSSTSPTTVGTSSTVTSLSSSVGSSTSSSFSTTSTSTFVVVSTVAAASSSASTTAAQLTSKSGLSKGAIVGIAVGASFGGLFLTVLFALFIFGYRKRRRDLKHLKELKGKAIADEKQPPSNGPYELSGISHMNEISNAPEGQNTDSGDIEKAVGESGPADRLEEG